MGRRGEDMRPEPKPVPCAPPSSKAALLLLEFARRRGIKLPLEKKKEDQNATEIPTPCIVRWVNTCVNTNADI